MRAAIRPFVTAGAILVGSGVIAATPIVAAPADIRVANSAVQLTAETGSLANLPVNLFYALANIPYYQVQALNSWADALQAGGSWWLKTPSNVWGWDPGNPPMIEAAVALFVPFPVISGNGGLPPGITPNGEGRPTAGPSEPITAENSILGGSAPPGTLGYILNVMAAAAFPMHEGCGFTCDDILTALGGYFQVPVWDLFDGYTFGEVINANDPTYPVAWSGATIAPINPLEPFTNFFNSLLVDPAESGGIKTVSLTDVINTVRRLNESATVAFNPVFPGSYLFTGFPLYDADILIGGLINGLVDRLCPICSTPEPPQTTEPLVPQVQTTIIEAAPETTENADTTTSVSSSVSGKRQDPTNRRSTSSAAEVEATTPETLEAAETPELAKTPEPEGQSALRTAHEESSTSTTAVPDNPRRDRENSRDPVRSTVKSITDRVDTAVSKVTERITGHGNKKTGSGTGDGDGGTGDAGGDAGSAGEAGE